MSVFTNPAGATPEQARQYATAVLGLLGDRDPLVVLQQMVEALDRVIEGLTLEELGTPQAAQKWSISAVVQHLADAELVWAFRLRMVLAEDRPAIVGYDQDHWAARLQYDRANIHEARDQFVALRNSNLSILSRASEEELQRVGVHPVRGEQSIQVLLRWWAGHDLLHMRQIERIRRALQA